MATRATEHLKGGPLLGGMDGVDQVHDARGVILRGGPYRVSQPRTSRNNNALPQKQRGTGIPVPR